MAAIKLSHRQIHIIQAIIFVLLIGGTITAVLPLGRFIDQRMQEIRVFAISEMESALNRKIQYDSISPSIFRFLEIRNFRLLTLDDEEFLRLSRVRIRYRLIPLLSGNIANAVYEISLENSSLVYNHERDSELYTLLTELGGSDSELPSGIRLRGRNLTVSISVGSTNLESSRLFFLLQSDESGQIRYQAKGDVRFREQELLGSLFEAKTELRIAGFAVFDEELNLELQTRNLDTSLFSLEDQVIQVSYSSERWRFTKIKDRAPIDISLGFDGDVFSFSTKMADFSPAMIISWKDPSIDSWLSTRFTGEFYGNYSLNNAALDYAFDFRAQASNRFLPVPISSYTRGNGTGEWVSFGNLSLFSRMGNLQFFGDLRFDNLLPNGRMLLTEIEIPNGNLVSADLLLRRRGNNISFETAYAQTTKVSFSELVGFFQLGDFENRFELQGRFDDALVENSFSVEGILTGTNILAEAVFESVPLADGLMLALGESDLISDLASEFVLSTQLAIESDFSLFSFAAETVTLLEPNNPDNSIEFTLSGNQSSFLVSDVSVIRDQYNFGGDIEGIFSPDGRLDFALDAELQGIPYMLSGALVPDQVFILTGKYGLFVEASYKAPYWNFQTRSRGFPLPILEENILLSLNSRGRFAGLDDYFIRLEGTELSQLPLPTETNRLSINANISPDGVDIARFNYADIIGPMVGNGEIDFIEGRGFDGWIQALGDGGEQVSVEFRFVDGFIRSYARLVDAKVSRISGNIIQGNLNGAAIVSGSNDDPNISFSGRISEGALYGDAFSLNFEGQYQDEEIRIQDTNLAYLSNRFRDGAGYYNLREGDFNFGIDYDGLLGDRSLSMFMRFTGDKILQPTGFVNRSDLRFQNIVWGESDVEDWDFQILQAPRSGISFKGGPSDSIQALFYPDERFDISLSAPLPLQLAGSGTLQGGIVDAEIRDVAADLAGLNPFFQVSFFQLLRGDARGELSVRGPITDPEIYGSVYTDNGYGSSEFVPLEIGPLNAEVVFNGKEILIPQILMRAGDGAAFVSASFLLNHWLPYQYSIELDASTTQGLPLNLAIESIRLVGDINGTLKIEGQGESTLIQGDLLFFNTIATFGEAVEDSGSLYDTDTTFDLKFTMGRRVEFLWPSVNFPILRATADEGSTLSISANTITEQFDLQGEVVFKGGEIFYFERNFFIREGILSFNEDELSFDPRFTARAEIREINEEGEDLKILLIVENNRLSQLTPRFESTPPMADVEILAFLGQNIYTQLLGQEVDITNALVTTGDLLGQFSLLRTFENRVKDIFQLDMFSIRTNMIENLLRERVFGEEPLDDSDVFERYLDNTSLFLGKNFTDDLFLETLVTFRTTDEAIALAQSVENFQIDAEVTLEWDTPLFLLELSFFPEFSDLFSSIEKTSLGIKWGYSF
jgi:translocation and assembly module TamB